MHLDFHITFHTPFRVATGTARAGVDSAVDPLALLPGSSLKGVMRAAAARLLPSSLVDDVFGAPGDAGPWSWTGAEFPVTPVIADRTRIALDNGVAAEGSLLINDEVWAHTATFIVEQQSFIAADDVDRHTTILEFAARSVHLLGADRRRGLGSVTVGRTPSSDPGQLARRILDLRTAGA